MHSLAIPLWIKDGNKFNYAEFVRHQTNVLSLSSGLDALGNA